MIERHGLGIVEVSFAGRAADHEHPHSHKARPYVANCIDQIADLGGCADKHILVENKERLDRANLAMRILDRKITILESLQDRVFNDLVVSGVLSFVFKSVRPMEAVRQFVTSNCLDAAGNCEGRCECERSHS